jgi:Tfp pilus assembly protein PilF
MREKMNRKNYILLAVVLCVVLLQVGCTESARTRSAHRRFDRVMEQARIDAALESIEQGRLQYAIRLLEDLIESGSAFSDQAKEILAELQFATKQLAEARIADAAIDDLMAIN